MISEIVLIAVYSIIFLLCLAAAIKRSPYAVALMWYIAFAPVLYLLEDRAPDSVFIGATVSYLLILVSNIYLIAYQEFRNEAQGEISRLMRTNDEAFRRNIQEYAVANRSLHDGVIENLLFAKNQIESNEHEEALACIDEAIRSAKAILHSNGSEILLSLGLKSALADLFQKFRKSGITLQLELLNVEMITDTIEAASLYFIVDEWLRNITLHSRSMNASLIFKVEDQSIQLSISDDGVGFKGDELGYGTSQIKTRAHMIGAKVKIVALAPHGTKLLLERPNQTVSSTTAP